MMKKILVLIAFFGISYGYAQFDIASLPEIPEEIKKGAGAIKRQEEIVFEVTDIDRAKYTVHQVYTVLNEEGHNALRFYEFTDKAVSLDDVEIKMYDASGKLINKVKKKDIYKEADMSGVAADNVYYMHELKPPAYPVTVEYKYQINYYGTLWYPEYSIINRGESVQSSNFTIKVPVSLDIRYKQRDIDIKPEITTDGNAKIYKWTVKNLPAVKYDESSVASRYYFPSVALAPNKFKIYNVDGDMSSWKSFGEWNYKLCQGLDELPEERKSFFAEMVKKAPDDKTKVALVYDYLQKNFRYVSIQLGIGGWKPFPAKFTDEKKYGDCKALSFYMHAVLKSLGIKSHIASINAGYNQLPADPAFPANNFNHVILCVPQKNDSIWLECTSQTTDFNYLSNFTENRNALLITEHGGVLVRTPASDPLKNRISTITTITFNETGAGESLTKIYSTGDFRERLSDISTEKLDKQKEYIVNRLGFKQPDDFVFTKKTTQDYELALAIEKIPEFTAGAKMFLRTRINRLVYAALPSAEGRTHDFYFDSPKHIMDTTIYNIPDGYIIDVLPRKTSVENEYVKYSTSFWYDEAAKKVYSTLDFCIKKNKLPVNQYAVVKKSFDEIVSDGTQKIVIKKS
jgi:transglutaminase-like putative cysteine protease